MSEAAFKLSDGVNVKEHIEKTIEILEALSQTEGIYSQRDKLNISSAQILLIETFGKADIKRTR